MSREQIESIEQDVRRLLRELAEARSARAEQEKGQADDKRRLLLAMVEVLDAFERVFQSTVAKEDRITPQMKIWLGNFRSVRRRLEKFVEEEGVARIRNLDEGFDPRWHRVAETVADPSRPEGTIVRETQPGYVWRNEVLRKAEVVAVRNTE
jgi:molecular chaperone GrpE